MASKKRVKSSADEADDKAEAKDVSAKPQGQGDASISSTPVADNGTPGQPPAAVESSGADQASDDKTPSVTETPNATATQTSQAPDPAASSAEQQPLSAAKVGGLGPRPADKGARFFAPNYVTLQPPHVRRK